MRFVWTLRIGSRYRRMGERPSGCGAPIAAVGGRGGQHELPTRHMEECEHERAPRRGDLPLRAMRCGRDRGRLPKLVRREPISLAQAGRLPGAGGKPVTCFICGTPRVNGFCPVHDDRKGQLARIHSPRSSQMPYRAPEPWSAPRPWWPPKQRSTSQRGRKGASYG